MPEGEFLADAGAARRTVPSPTASCLAIPAQDAP